MMQRIVQTEWLDVLADRDPLALRSRRDIRRLSRLMGNDATLARLLRRRARPPGRIVELGAGDGLFMLRVVRRLSSDPRTAAAWQAGHIVLVDCKNVVTRETRRAFAALGWTVEVVTSDVFDWLHNDAGAAGGVIVANLFLHQFRERQLAEILRLAAERTRFFAACEPGRSRFALGMSRMLGVIGCNAVTRHDGVASVRAGFRGSELSRLWPSAREWSLHERDTGWFAHAFAAERISDH
jgi:hypothetical protein